MPINDDLTFNNEELLNNLIKYVTQKNRVHPIYWIEIHNLENEKGTRLADIGGFPLSLILGGSGSNNAEKSQRLIEQIRFSYKHHYLDIVNWYLQSLPDDHRMYGSLSEPGYDDLCVRQRQMEDEIAIDGLRLCLSLFDIEKIELIPKYSDQKKSCGKVSFNEYELGSFFVALGTLYPLSAETLDRLINCFEVGEKQLKFANDWPVSTKEQDEWDKSRPSKEKDFWEKRLIENEAMIIRFKLLRLYLRYTVNLQNIFPHSSCDLRDFSELIWDIYEETTNND
ncbi:hypothetical protein OAI19_04230 [Porticoccaceae bacterium]|nr:hypothetical protein [Porticoccaceae bacterium]